jgi:cytochrome c-type biogenesis protein CcmH
VSGWVVLALLVCAVTAALWLMRMRGSFLLLAVAFLAFGCAGYALQGSPDLPDSPRLAAPRGAPMPTAPIRHAFFGDFTPAEHWLILSESFTNRGETQDAVDVMDAAVREHPDDPQLWIGLGNALVEHAGELTPASEFAYKRAAELAPGHPAAGYFFGLALARSGDAKDAVAIWNHVLATAPAEASWRPIIEDSIVMLSGGKRAS